MSKKTITILICIIIFPVLTSLACLSGVREKISDQVSDFVDDQVGEVLEEVVEEIVPQTEEEAIPTEALPTEAPVVEEPTPQVPISNEKQDIIMLDISTWIQDAETVFVAYLFQNPNSSYMFEDADFSFYLYDSNGMEIGSNEYYVSQIYPEEKIGIVFNYYLPDAQTIVDSISVEWEIRNTVASQGAVNPLSPSTINFWPSGGYPVVTGSIENSSSSILTNIQTNIVCYNSAGEIVGGGSTYVDFVPNGAQVGFSNYVEAFEDVALVEAYPYMTYGSMVIDDPDAWTKISILEDNFYQGTYNWVYGGAVIRNDTADFLEDSVFFATFYDSSGKVVTVASAYIDFLFPGEILGFAPWIYSLPEDALMTTSEIWILPGRVADNYELSSNPFVVNSTELIGDYQDTVLVNFTNTYSKQVSEVEVFVIVRNASGEIIGGGSDWTDEPTPAGGRSSSEVYVSVDSGETIATIEAWVLPSFWTNFE
jgi:hypothetical protein